MTALITLRLTGSATSQQTQTYVNLPFDVPDGIARIDVEYTYSDAVGSDPHLTQGNTVDIGIFDARGAGFNTEGFRGWSGSARSGFFVATDDATPGYRAGAIQAGTWFICLGLYKIAPQGCEYAVNVTLTPAVSDTASVFTPLLPLREAAGKRSADGWYRGEMHCHSTHSDGDSDPLDVVRKAEALGLDFFAITDHNNITHLARLNTIETPLILIPGFEVTTYKGHWNAWGDQGWIDFRIEQPEQMAQAVAEASRRGFVVSLNHPRPFGPDWVYEDVDDFDCIEVWNGPWMAANDVALEFWEKRLRTGRRYIAVGGSDAHFHLREHPAKLGQPTLWIKCDGEPTAPKLLAAIRAGHVAISESPTGARITLSAGDAMMGDTVAIPADGKLLLSVGVSGGAGSTLELWTATGCAYSVPVNTPDFSFETALDVSVGGTVYVRAQLVDRQDEDFVMRALTNPIYIR